MPFSFRSLKVILNALIVIISVTCTFLAVILTKSGSQNVIPELKKDQFKEVTVAPKDMKHIYMDFPGFYELIMGQEHFRECPVSNCALTNVAFRYPDSDAVIFYTHYWKGGPPVKSNNQIWIYFAVESPVYCFNQILGESAWKNLFNWTMTYRYDSDIWFGYGRVVPRSKNVTSLVDYDKVVKDKDKVVAWIVSNCETQSKRKEYVHLLQTKISVDVFGNCGNLKCPKDSSEACLGKIVKEYKFYLSFENSLCKDYLTEKVFKMLKYDIVPIVRGGTKYKDVLPHKSVINAADFKSTEELATYLKFLDQNPEEYKKYFEWKKDYDVIEPARLPFCELCKRVNDQERFKKVYENVNDWYHKDACWEATDIL